MNLYKIGFKNSDILEKLDFESEANDWLVVRGKDGKQGVVLPVQDDSEYYVKMYIDDTDRLLTKEDFDTNYKIIEATNNYGDIINIERLMIENDFFGNYLRYSQINSIEDIRQLNVGDLILIKNRERVIKLLEVYGTQVTKTDAMILFKDDVPFIFSEYFKSKNYYYKQISLVS